MFKKKFLWKPINWTQIFNYGQERPGSPAKKHQLDIEHSGGYPPPLTRPRKQWINFLQNSWSCPQAYSGAGRRQKLLLDGATDFLWKIWQHITTVQDWVFCPAFSWITASSVSISLYISPQPANHHAHRCKTTNLPPSLAGQLSGGMET